MLYWTLGLLFNIENRSQYDYWNYSFVDNGEVWNWIPIEKKDQDKQKVTFLVDLPTELTNFLSQSWLYLLTIRLVHNSK